MTFRVLLLLSLSVAACEGENPAGVDEPGAGDGSDIRGEVVDPPFSLRGEAQGLLLAWVDAEGIHTAQRRSDIPAARREHVRVESLQVAPEDRLDPDYVYVADLRSAADDGEYTVRKVRRAAFDAYVDRETGAEEVLAQAEVTEGDVIIYGADWCNVCRRAASYFRSRGIPFVEKNIEHDPAAAAEMQSKARAAGVTTNGIPVIDVRGTILSGFDQARIERALAGG